MTATRHRGLFTIPVTPFGPDGALDEDSLRRVLAFCFEAGAHGVVTPVNASEFSTLDPHERAPWPGSPWRSRSGRGGARGGGEGGRCRW